MIIDYIGQIELDLYNQLQNGYMVKSKEARHGCSLY